MNNHIHILSMNVTDLISNTKNRLDVFNWVNAKKISIVCFQETHSAKDGSQMGGRMG
jgi:exonuclease III